MSKTHVFSRFSALRRARNRRETDSDMSDALSQTRVVVVGNGLVGHRFVEELRERDPERTMQITVVGEEPRFAYDRVHLSAYFEGTPAAELAVASRERYQELGVETILGDRVEKIDRVSRVVTTGAGFKLHYDMLVLATGSKAFVPPLQNVDGLGCFVYRTIDDVLSIEAYAKKVKRGIVIGGGLLGLEAARALKGLGLETTVVEFAPRLMPMQLDAVGGRMLRSRIESLGVTVRSDTNSSAVVLDEHRKVKALQLVDGSRIETDLILFSAGIRPRDELARDCGLAIGARGGIVIDDHCRTNDAHIYAIGECALWENKIYGLVGPGYTMARTAAGQIFGETHHKFEGADMSTKLKLMGVDVCSFGDAFGTTEGARGMSVVDEYRDIYKRIILSADGKKLLGGMLVGDASDYDYLSALARDGSELPSILESLLVAPGEARPQLALGDTSVIC
ncbi:MAG TPA: FAD-dependent oxidoreductase, partial [Polyangiales bacterium]|nr:FAD-dependent oxidoreductase [Polyangiales bacterium]